MNKLLIRLSILNFKVMHWMAFGLVLWWYILDELWGYKETLCYCHLSLNNAIAFHHFLLITCWSLFFDTVTTSCESQLFVIKLIQDFETKIPSVLTSLGKIINLTACYLRSVLKECSGNHGKQRVSSFCFFLYWL